MAAPVTDFGLPRLDLFRKLHPNLGAGGEPPIPPEDRDSLEDPEVRCYRSGFWATVPIPATEPGAEIPIALRARLGDGSTVEHEAGRIAAAAAPVRAGGLRERRRAGRDRDGDLQPGHGSLPGAGRVAAGTDGRELGLRRQ